MRLGGSRQFQRKITLGKGNPLKAEGVEGDLSVRQMRDGFKLFIKHKNRWHGIKVGQAFEKLEQKIDSSTGAGPPVDNEHVGLGKAGNLHEAISWFSGTNSSFIRIKEQDDDNGIMLKNDAGTLVFRNHGDTGGVTTKSQYFDAGTHFKVGGTEVLSSNTLGSGIRTSSLTQVGTLGSLSIGANLTSAGADKTLAISTTLNASSGGGTWTGISFDVTATDAGGWTTKNIVDIKYAGNTRWLQKSDGTIQMSTVPKHGESSADDQILMVKETGSGTGIFDLKYRTVKEVGTDSGVVVTQTAGPPTSASDFTYGVGGLIWETDTRIIYGLNSDSTEIVKWTGTQHTSLELSLASFNATFTSGGGNVGTTYEIGSGNWKTAGQITFAATYNNGPPSNAQVYVTGGEISETAVSSELADPYNAGTNDAAAITYPSTRGGTRRFKIIANDDASLNMQDSTINFYNKIFYTGSSTTIDTEAEVEAMSSHLYNNITFSSYAAACPTGSYAWYALPQGISSSGSVKFLAQSENGGSNYITCPFTNTTSSLSITNPSGFTENYRVWKSDSDGIFQGYGSNIGQFKTGTTEQDFTYYGVSDVNSQVDLEADSGAKVKALDDTDGVKVITTDCTQIWNEVTTTATHQYFIIAFPDNVSGANGSLTWTDVNEGLSFSMEAVKTVSVTNQFGNVQNYYVWVSSDPLGDGSDIQVQSS